MRAAGSLARIRAELPYSASFEGICYRTVRFKYATRLQALSIDGSTRTGGRFNPIGAFGALYLSLDPHTCFDESTGWIRFGAFDATKFLPRVTVAVHVTLSRVLDLTQESVRERLDVLESTLKQTNWEAIQASGRIAATQRIASNARKTGFEAIIYPSAASAGSNIAIFSDRLLEGSNLEIVNADQLPEGDSERV